MTYTEQLLDYRWKAKRKVILERDNYTCIECYSKENLHVHHIQYTGYAWEAPDSDLITLCASCHRRLHRNPPKEYNLGDYSLMFDYAIAKATKLAYEATPTLNVLIANVESENLVRMRSTRIAQFLDVSEQTVERHLKKLRTLQIIIPDVAEGDKPRAVFNWRICPYLSWKGSVESLNTYLKTLPPDHHWRTYSQDKATAVQEHSA